ncbi:hypothetical protein ABIC12_004780 [Pantoea agglomerans]|jgi:hypothetical protein|nr:hypothetical protein [Pantoea agglomerans]
MIYTKTIASRFLKYVTEQSALFLMPVMELSGMP